MRAIDALWGRLDDSPDLDQRLYLGPDSGKEHYFDLASLTKPIVTGSLFFDALLRSPLGRDFCNLSVRDFVPELPQRFQAVSLLALLEHRGGLAPFEALVDLGRDPPASRAEATQQVLSRVSLDPLTSPASTYSDLSFILLGLCLERSANLDLHELWKRWQYSFGLDRKQLLFGAGHDRLPCHPTEVRHAVGAVNDDRAAFLSGVAPHAGLFGTAYGVAAFLRVSHQRIKAEPKLKAAFAEAPRGRFFWGYDQPSDSPDSQGGYPAASSVLGHLGFTGTAFWWDPKSSRFGVLLSNRVFPSANPASLEIIRRLRREFFSRLWQNQLEGASWKNFVQGTGYISSP